MVRTPYLEGMHGVLCLDLAHRGFSVVAHIGDQNPLEWGGYLKSRDDLTGAPVLPRPAIVVGQVRKMLWCT
jgi:hypothetical protein